MSSCSSTPTTVKELTQEVLQANKDHQYALKVYTERLEAELEAVDKLLAAAEVPDDEPDVDVGGHLELLGAVKAQGPIPPEIAPSDHPFADDVATRHQYLRYTTVHAMKSSDLEALADAVRSENHRIYALEAQKMGQQPFVALNEHPQPFFEQNKEGINWERVAQKVSAAGSHGVTRTAQECEIRWLGERHPDFDRSPWSQSEIAKVRELVGDAKEGEVDWVDIAAKLGTRRTPIDCMRHAVQRRQHVWTPESDQRLLEMVNIYGTENWLIVARQVSEDATAAQCQSRYQRTLDPNLRRGPWTPEEDERLKRAVEVFGRSWMDVCQFVPTRSNEQCRERWQDHLNPTVGRGKWTEEEDQALLAAYEQFGDRWREVSQRVGNGRTDNMCRHRHVLLMKRKAKETATNSPAPQDSGVSTPESMPGPSQSRRRSRAQTTQLLESSAPTPSTQEASTPAPAPPKTKPKPRARAKRTQVEKESEPVASATTQAETGAEHEQSSSQTTSAETSNVTDGSTDRLNGRSHTEPASDNVALPASVNAQPEQPKRRRGRPGPSTDNKSSQAEPGAGDGPATKKRRIGRKAAVISAAEADRSRDSGVQDGIHPEQPVGAPQHLDSETGPSHDEPPPPQDVPVQQKPAKGRGKRPSPPPPTRQSARLRKARS